VCVCLRLCLCVCVCVCVCLRSWFKGQCCNKITSMFVDKSGVIRRQEYKLKIISVSVMEVEWD